MTTKQVSLLLFGLFLVLELLGNSYYEKTKVSLRESDQITRFFNDRHEFVRFYENTFTGNTNWNAIEAPCTDVWAEPAHVYPVHIQE